MAKAKVKKVVLAYSGGLDTSVIIPWLKENYDGCEVIAACVDIGQGDEVAPVHDKALKSGASKAYVEDLTQEFLEDYVWPTLKAQAVYEGLRYRIAQRDITQLDIVGLSDADIRLIVVRVGIAQVGVSLTVSIRSDHRDVRALFVTSTQPAAVEFLTHHLVVIVLRSELLG